MKNTYLARLLCIALIGLGISTSAHGQVIEQIDYGAVGNFILDTNGSSAPVGDAVLLGTWAPGFDFSANQTFASLSAAFTQYDSSSIQAPGQFADSVVLTTAGQENKQLYIWVLNNSTAASATAWVILTNTTDTDWKVPTDAGSGAQTIIDTSDPGTFIPPGAFGIGVFSASSPNNNDWKMTSTVAIPEPSTYALLGLGAVGMMGLRRRIKR